MEELIQSIRAKFAYRNYLDLQLGRDLTLAMEELTDNYEYQEQWGTFPIFLAEFGKSFKQVKPFMSAYKWISDNGLNIEDIKDIPLTKLNLMATLEVALHDELLYELRELSYTDLKIKYQI